MPWHTDRSTKCPASKPYAVIKDSDGTIQGCHATRAAALTQMAALYAQEAVKAMHHKSFEIVETKTDQASGTFEALVSVFGNVDRGGDRVQPGAFTKTLRRWRKTGDPIPVILSHQWDNPMAHIGIADPHDVTETDRGLLVKGTLDVTDNEVARQVHKLLKRRSLREFSFGYDVPEGGSKRAKDGALDLNEIDLVEVGPTLKGMNEATELYAVKSLLGVPPSAADLRAATADLERGEQERQIPRLVPVPEPDPDPEPEPDPDPEPVPVPAGVLRKHAERVRREREAEQLPDDVDPLPAAPGLDLAVELAAVKQSIAELRDSLHALAKNDDAPDPQNLRRRAEAERRQHEAEQLPDDVDPEPVQVEPDTAGPDGGPRKTPETLDAIVHPDDVEGAKSGHLKAVWSAGYVNDLPDSAFLHVSHADGAPVRAFPYKDADGTIDLPHLRNAVARIPQSDLSQPVKDQAAARAQRILDAQTKSVDATGQAPNGARTVDPLRRQAETQALEFASGGLSLRKPPRTVPPPPPHLVPLPELKRRMRDEMLRHLNEDTQ